MVLYGAVAFFAIILNSDQFHAADSCLGMVLKKRSFFKNPSLHYLGTALTIRWHTTSLCIAHKGGAGVVELQHHGMAFERFGQGKGWSEVEKCMKMREIGIQNAFRDICRGGIPLWVLPSAYTIFYFLPRAVHLESHPPHTGVKVGLRPKPM